MNDNALLIQTLADIRSEMRQGFQQVNARLDAINGRVHRAEKDIEHARARIDDVEERIDDIEQTPSNGTESLVMSKGMLGVIVAAVTALWSVVSLALTKWWGLA